MKLALATAMVVAGVGSAVCARAEGQALLSATRAYAGPGVGVGVEAGQVALARQLSRQQASGSAGAETEPWAVWQRRPAEPPLILEAVAMAGSGTTVTIRLAGSQYTFSGVGCGTETETNLFVVPLRAHQEFTLTVSGPQLYYFRLNFRSYIPRQVMTARGASGAYRPYKTMIDGFQQPEGEWLEQDFGSCANNSKSWNLELRPDRGYRPVSLLAYEEHWSRDEENVDEQAPGDGMWPELGPGLSPSPTNAAFRWAVNLGRLWNGQAAGMIRLSERNITSNLFTAGPLAYTERSTNLAEMRVITNAGGHLRQVRAPQALVDIQSTYSPSQQCVLKFYRLTQVSGTTNGSGLFTINDDNPFVTWKVRNPNSPGAYGRVQFVEERPGGRHYTNEVQYESGPQKWSLFYGTGHEQRTESRTVTISGGTTRTETVEIRSPTNVVYQAVEKYGQFAWGWELTNVVTQPGGNGLTNAFVYYTVATNQNSYRKLKERWYPGGRWEAWYHYHAQLGGCPEWPFGNPGSFAFDEARVGPWKDGPATPAQATLSNSTLLLVRFGSGQDVHGSRFYTERINTPEGKVSTLRHWMESDGDYSDPGITRPAEYKFRGAPDYGGLGVSQYTKNNRHRRPGHYLHDLLDYLKFEEDMDEVYEHAKGTFSWNNWTWTSDETNGVDFATLKTKGSYYADDDNLYPSAGYQTAFSLTTVYQGKSTQELTIYQGGNAVLTVLSAMSGVTNDQAVWRDVESRILSYDTLGHVTNIVWRDAANTNITRTVYQASWVGPASKDCELKQWEVFETGQRLDYAYDSLKRLTSVVQAGVTNAGYPAQLNIATNRLYDAAGRLTRETVSGGSLSLTRSVGYGVDGRITYQVDLDGIATALSYSADTRTVTETLPGPVTRVRSYYLDGRPKSLTGSAQLAQYYDYWALANETAHSQYPDVWPDPTGFTRVYLGSLGSPRWSERATSTSGDVAVERVPAFDPGGQAAPLQTEYVYELWGNLFWKETPTTTIDGTRYDLVEYYDYTDYGDLYATEQTAVNSDPRWLEQHSLYKFDGSHWWLETQEITAPISQTITNRARHRLSGFSSGNTLTDAALTDPLGNVTTVTVTVDRNAKQLTAVTNTPQSTITVTAVTINGLLQTRNSESVATPTWFLYDALGRPVLAQDPLGFTSTTTFDPATGWVSATADAAGRLTHYEYYTPSQTNAGRVKCITAPNGKQTRFQYDALGQLRFLWGDVPYPEERIYNSYGELTQLHTYQGGTNWAGATWPGAAEPFSQTTWNYDPATGLLLSKVDDTGKGYTNSYQPTRELWTRKWARGVTITNQFNGFGVLTRKDYSDGTPSTVSAWITASGQPCYVTDAFGTRNFNYDPLGRILSVAWNSPSPLYGLSITNRHDPVYGRDRVALTGLPSVGTLTRDYRFDTATGRLLFASNSTWSVVNGYLPQSDLVQSVTAKTGSTPVLTTTRAWDFGYRLRSIQSALGAGSGAVVSAHSYVYDQADRRTRATLQDNSAWAYDYNDRNEVLSGKRVWADHVPVAGQQFEYAYDPAGNRTQAKLGGDAAGATLRLNTYTRNALNQYTVRTNASATDVLGAAKATATVAVNGVGAYEKGEYFWRAVPVSNSSAPVYPTITVVATEGANSATNSGKVYLGPVQESFSYDLDGNLTADSHWDYTWDPENRLKRMETRPAAITAGVPRTRLDFAYDAEGRRTQKSVLTNWNGSVYQTTNVTRFLYDPGIQTGGGWNLLAEVDGANNVRRSYAWGLDLMGNLETEGNIGGLLMVVDHTGGSAVCHFAAYDGNGNLTALVKTDQTVAARYEYGPFGEPIRMTGALAKANPFRWSTKFTDEESGLVDYGYRLYSPSLGRWMSRDPIEEEDIRNLYAFVGNRPSSLFDLLGQSLAGTLPNPSEMERQAVTAKQALGIKERAEAVADFAADFADIWDIALSLDDPTALLSQIHEIRDDLFSMHDIGKRDGPVGHHMLAQRLRGIFTELMGQGAIDRDQFMKGLSNIAHRRLHSGAGFDGKFASGDRGSKGGMWNFLMRMFMVKHGDKPSPTQIDDFVKQLGGFFFGE